MSEGSEGRAFPVSYVEFLDPEFTGALDTGRDLFRGAGGGGIAELLDPKEERFVCNCG